MKNPHRGGAPVGHISELNPVEATSIMYLRFWCEGGAYQQEIGNDFVAALGPELGKKIKAAFDDLCRMCYQHGRRSLMRHATQCKCVGGDESCFANFIGYAADGEREDAFLMATLLVRPDMAPLAVSLATEVGLALKRMQLLAPASLDQTPPQHAKIH